MRVEQASGKKAGQCFDYSGPIGVVFCHNNAFPLSPPWGFPRIPYSPVASPPFSFACLATLRVDFFNEWTNAKRVCAEVTQVE